MSPEKNMRELGPDVWPGEHHLWLLKDKNASLYSQLF